MNGLKKVLIVSHGMEIGGAESALLGLLSAFDYSQFSVDLFLYQRTGELLKYIPEQVNILPENPKYASIAAPLPAVIKNRAFGVALGRVIGKSVSKHQIKKSGAAEGSYFLINNSHKYTRPFLPMISEKEYDLAISFLTPHFLVTEKCRAKKKIAWIHTDYSSIEIDAVSELPMWEAYDGIVSISDKVTEAFLVKFPSLKDKITVIENIHPAGFIRRRAEEFTVKDEMPDDGYVKLLSVGRYAHAKNFDNLPFICAMMKNVKWYIIGYGTDEALIKEKIAEAGVEDRVILLGKKENPYPYFKECDFYVQPSRYEGNAVTVNEALILGKKVAIADYATAKSQIEDGVNGVIVPQDNEGCAAGLMNFIRDKELQDKILSNVINSDWSKSDEINKIIRIAGN